MREERIKELLDGQRVGVSITIKANLYNYLKKRGIKLSALFEELIYRWLKEQPDDEESGSISQKT